MLSRQLGRTAAAGLVVPPSEVAPPLEVFPLVIYLGLAVTHRWDVGKFAGVWSLSLVAVIKIRPFVVVRPALCWSVFGGAIGGVRG